jgi:hypothetical protein
MHNIYLKHVIIQELKETKAHMELWTRTYALKINIKNEKEKEKENKGLNFLGAYAVLV